MSTSRLLKQGKLAAKQTDLHSTATGKNQFSQSYSDKQHSKVNTHHTHNSDLHNGKSKKSIVRIVHTGTAAKFKYSTATKAHGYRSQTTGKTSHDSCQGLKGKQTTDFPRGANNLGEL